MSDSWTILVADDNPVARAQVVAILSEIGHAPVPVEDGNEARSALSALSFDLVVLDHDMPGANGDEIARECNQPVIGLSSSGVERSEWDGSGIVDWLSKPVDARALAMAVQKAMTAGPDSEQEAAAPVDMAHLSTYTGGDRNLESELAELFRASCDRYLDEMAGSTDDRVWKNAAHGLKGAARGIGANEMGRLAAFAETLLGDAMAGRRAETLNTMRAEADRVSDFFNDWFEQHPA